MKTLLLIDANSIIHRCFHALPPLTTPAGEPIQAVYGLSNILLRILKENPPDYAAAAFDRKEKTFRAEVFKEYKAHRPPTPSELISQIKESYKLFEIFNVAALDLAGFEADDIIGTLVEKFKKEKDLNIVILSGDLDNLQLVEENVAVRTFIKGVSETTLYDEAKVEERYGLKPRQLPDYKGLVGDPSDNIPGVSGIGPKTAFPIIKNYGNLDNFYAKVKKLDLSGNSRDEKLFRKLLEFEEQALQSRDLAVIRRDAPIQIEKLEELKWTPYDRKVLGRYFESLGFKTLVNRISEADEPGGRNAVFIEGEESAPGQKKDILESDKILKIGFGIKNTIKALRRRDIILSEPYFDLGIAYWLLDPDAKKYDFASLCGKFLHKEPEEKDRISLFNFARKKLDEYGLRDIFEKMEMPLLPILADMETAGIKVDVPYLKKISRELERDIEAVESEIYRNAGLKFNINSSQQLSEVLFRKIGISAKGVKKTKGGKISTAFENLDYLKDKHPLIPLILSYRELFKLKSTYVDPFTELADENGRIHTNYLQTGTATGRLSSQDPNLQNIPVGSEWADKFRKAFEAEKDFSFVSFDYSQIELRILASVSGDERMTEAFRRGDDIHAITAANIFNVDVGKVTTAMRRVAKTLNFGVIYGMGAVSFAETSGLSREEAQNFISEYFADFPAIKRWQERIKEEARTFGFVKNLNGRRRWTFNIVSGNHMLAAEAERSAINMPIQSLDADIMKMAMIKVWREINSKKWPDGSVRMLLTIHDELLLEIRDDMIKKAAPEIRGIMESVYGLAVPLKVDVAVGKRLADLKK